MINQAYTYIFLNGNYLHETLVLKNQLCFSFIEIYFGWIYNDKPG